MIGIENIGVNIAENRIDNVNKIYDDHQVDEFFVKEKVGIVSVAHKAEDQNTVDLCMEAFGDLRSRVKNLDLAEVDCLCVCTQNGEYQLPHTAAILQEKLGLTNHCAAFDISLGCSGYVYAINILTAFMEANGYKKGMVFTCDPYSKIIDPNDKNTDLIFGDAATVTLLGKDYSFALGNAVFYTEGKEYPALIKRDGEPLYMDGRKIFNFVMKHVPENIEECLEKNKIARDHIDLFILHQASKYVVDNLMRRMKLDKEKVPFVIGQYGNTVSSSIPILLQSYLEDTKVKTALLCGFGVGLSVASVVIYRK